MENKLVAFLDILGFSHAISQGAKFEAKFEEYTQIIETSIKSIDKDNVIEYLLSSDSIIITVDNNEENFKKLVQILSILSYEMLTELSIPLKGCVTSGNISYLNKNKKGGVVIAGQPIVEAYGYEQKQNWVGIMISPNTINSIADFSAIEYCDINEILLRTAAIPEKLKILKKENNLPLLMSVQRYNEIPFKSDNEGFEGFVIVPYSKICINKPGFLTLALFLYLGILDKLMLYSSTPDIQIKYKNTKKFISAMRDNIHALWENEIFREVFSDVIKEYEKHMQQLEKLQNENNQNS